MSEGEIWRSERVKTFLDFFILFYFYSFSFGDFDSVLMAVGSVRFHD